MRAGEKRKFYRNMQFEQSARTLAVVGANLFAFAGPLVLILIAVGIYIGLNSPKGDEQAHVPTMLGFAGLVGGGRNFLEVMEEGDKLGVVGDWRKRIEGFEEKFSKFVGLIVNKPGYSRHKREYLMKEAETTSDFPILFGTVLERQLLAKYQTTPQDWQSYIKRGTQNDFRPADAIGIYGLEGKLDQVRERGEYKAAALGDGKVQITLKKYGREFPLSWESLINDDLGAFSDIAERLANAARRTEYYQATSQFVAAAGPHASLYGAPIAHPIDANNVTNKGVLPLTHDNLGLTAKAMRHFRDADNEPVILDGFELVVPPALEWEMLKILNPASVVVSGGDATAGAKQIVRTSANVVNDLMITGHVNPYLPIIDTSGSVDKTWYLFAKLSSGAAAKLNFLRGHEQPEICMKNPNKVSLGGGGLMNPFEGDFETDSVMWRVRHVMGGAPVDPRMTYAQVAP